MKHLSVLVAVFALTASAVGCGAMSPYRISDRPEILELLASGSLPKVESHSVAISPVVLQITPSKPQKGAPTASVAPDAGVIQGSFVDSLRELELFKEIKKVEGKPRSGWEAWKLSSDSGSDLVIVPKITAFKVTYEGRNNAYIPKMIVWSLLEWVSWFMADENYRVDMTCNFELLECKEYRSLDTKNYTISTTKPVSDFQRGIKIWGMVRSPDCLNEDNFKNVALTLGPHASREMEVGFVRSVMRSFKPSIDRWARQIEAPEKDNDRKRPPRGPRVNVAYIFGVDSYDELTISPLKHAASDAAAFKGLLETSSEPTYMKTLYTNEAASLSAMRDVFNKASSSRTRLGTLIFYFAGRGALTMDSWNKPLFYILPQDADALNLKETALSLDELARSLRLIRADHIIVILDCGFDPFGEGRSLPTGADFKRSVRFPPKLVGKSGLTLMAACLPRKTAFAPKHLQRGLLTHLIINAALDMEVVGEDYALNMIEIQEYIKKAAPKISRQEPWVRSNSRSGILVGQKPPERPESPEGPGSEDE